MRAHARAHARVVHCGAAWGRSPGVGTHRHKTAWPEVPLSTCIAGAVPLPPLSHWRAAPELCVLLLLSVGRTMRARTRACRTLVVPGGDSQTQDCMFRGASSYLQAGAVPLPPLSHWRAAPELCVLLLLSVGRTMRARTRACRTLVVPGGDSQTQDCMFRGASSYLQAGAVPLPPLSRGWCGDFFSDPRTHDTHTTM